MPSSQALQQANQFNIPGKLTVKPGRHKLACVEVDSDLCQAKLYLLGACPTQWKPAGHKDVLFTSRASYFKEGRPIRGGVPVCFPWFGPHPEDPDAPSHGLVRTKHWNLIATRETPDGVDVELATNLDHLHVDYHLSFGKQLKLRFIVSNTSDEDQTFEQALHTYLTLGDATKASITGLENAEYVDKMHEGETFNQGDEPITFTEETDRVYLDTTADCVLTDPVMNRKITVAKTGSKSTVVWNPWVNKANRLEDMGDEEWQKMCCIESANIAPDTVTIAPGGSHTMTVTLSVEALV